MYKTIVEVISECEIPDRYELENIIVGLGNGCCGGEVTISPSQPLTAEEEEKYQKDNE